MDFQTLSELSYRLAYFLGRLGYYSDAKNEGINTKKMIYLVSDAADRSISCTTGFGRSNSTTTFRIQGVQRFIFRNETLEAGAAIEEQVRKILEGKRGKLTVSLFETFEAQVSFEEYGLFLLYLASLRVRPGVNVDATILAHSKYPRALHPLYQALGNSSRHRALIAQSQQSLFSGRESIVHLLRQYPRIPGKVINLTQMIIAPLATLIIEVQEDSLRRIWLVSIDLFKVE